MSKYDIIDYMTGVNTETSMMNFIDIKSDLTTDDYYEVILSDNYKYRLDLLADVLLGNKQLYFLIMLINEINTLNDLEAGDTLKIPTTNFIEKYYNRLKKEVLP